MNDREGWASSSNRSAEIPSEAERRLEERIDAALGDAPEFALPADFAARVMAVLPSEPKVTGAELSHYGQKILLGCGALLAVVLLMLMMSVTREPRWLLSLLSLELAVVAVVGGPWRRVLRLPD